MDLSLQRGGDLPLYRQIVNQIRDGIRNGTLTPGCQLPTVRQLALDYGLTRLTVHSAYSELQSQGLLESQVGRGTFVATDVRRYLDGGPPPEPPAAWVSQGQLAELLRSSELPGIVSFAQAFPAPESYPLRQLERVVQKVAGQADAWAYGAIQGEIELREQISALLLDRGVAVPPEHLLITAGAQQGIALAVRALTQPSDTILVEAPTYPGVLDVTAQRGQRVVGVPGDGNGILPDALEAACRAHEPRLLYLVPTYGNPTGTVLLPERREAVLRLARTHRLIVVEDDVYGLLTHGSSSPPALKADDRDGRVVLLASFSKVLAPSLRLGAIAAPPDLLPVLAAAKQANDLVCSALLQRALAEFLRRGDLAAHLQQVRPLYRERRGAMVSALTRHLPDATWTEPAGGLSLWVQLPAGAIEHQVVGEAIEQGIGVAPGRAFFPQLQSQVYLRLSYGMHAPAQIEQGMAILGGVLQDHLRRNGMVSFAGQMSRPLV